MTARVSLPPCYTALCAVSIISVARSISTASYWARPVALCTIKFCLADSFFTYAIILITASISPTLKTTLFTDPAIISCITRFTVRVTRARSAVLWTLHATFFAVKPVKTIVTKSRSKITSSAETRFGAAHIALAAVVPCIT